MSKCRQEVHRETSNLVLLNIVSTVNICRKSNNQKKENESVSFITIYAIYIVKHLIPELATSVTIGDNR